MTLKELAQLAGVSPAAVSLVLNNKAGVGEEKRQEILQLMKEHNYTPTKRTQHTPSNLLFLKYIKNGHLVEENTGFIASIMDSIEAECRSRGYSLRIVVSNNNLEQTLHEIDFSSVNGIFVLGTELDPTSYPILNEIPVPYIVIDNDMPNFHCNTITMANQEMVYEAISHLASLKNGIAELGYFRSCMPTQNFAERANGFRLAANDYNFTHSESSIFLLQPTMLGAYSDMKHYLEKDIQIPKFCFADNDTIAIGAIKALKEFQYKLPKDIYVIGFDDIGFAAINSPTLSTMRVHKNQIGYLAVKSLNDSIRDSSHRNVKIQVGGEIIVRQSTTP